MNKTKLILKIGIIVATLCFVSFAYAFSASRTTHTSGIVSNMGVYLDQACTTPLTTIDWGITIQPGATITKDAWIKNVASYTMTLSNTISAWIPSNTPTYIHLAWDGTSESVAPGTALETTFTLTVDANIGDSNPLIGDFSFDVTITGTG